MSERKEKATFFNDIFSKIKRKLSLRFLKFDRVYADNFRPYLTDNERKIIITISTYSAVVLFLVVGGLVLFNQSRTSTTTAGVIQTANVQTIKQTQIVAGGAPLKWTKLIKQSDITNTTHLLKLPKESTQIKVETITQQQAKDLQQQPIQQLSLAEKNQLAISKQSNGMFFASILDSLSSFTQYFMGALKDGVDKLTKDKGKDEEKKVKEEKIEKIEDAVVVDLAPVVEPAPEPVVETVVETPAPVIEAPVLEPVTETPVVVETPVLGTPEPSVAESEPEAEAIVAVTYETPAPTITEQDTDTGKFVTINSNAESACEYLNPNKNSLTDVVGNAGASLLNAVKQFFTLIISSFKNATASLLDAVDLVGGSNDTFVEPAPTPPPPPVVDDSLYQECLATQAQLTDILASTKIPEIYKVGQESKIKIKWTNENDKDVTFHAYDTNNNGKLDYIEWTVPHLSTQTFEIIFISKAFHLDENKNIIEDIYDTVSVQDGVYATIPQNNYVRVTFEKILDNTKDITIFARTTNYSLPTTYSSIEVYPVYTDAEGNQTQGAKLILENDGTHPDFSEITTENTYRVLLTNLDQPTDVFDLRVVSTNYSLQTTNSLDIDYIVDPSSSEGPLSPGTVVSVMRPDGYPWTNPSNAVSSNNSYATADAGTEISDYLKATNFGFNIPVGATIDGIKVEIERHVPTLDDSCDMGAFIVKGGSVMSATNRSDSSICPMSDADAYKTYGGETDKWGETWTVADINSSDFGFAYEGSSHGAGLLYVDHIRITVYYTPETTPPAPSSFSPASASTIYDSTPTITFTTDENAYCRASTTDETYANMSDNDDCTGDGTTSQSCTLSDLGSAGSKNVYIACSDGTNEDTADTNENLAYTLGVATSPTSPGTMTDDSAVGTITWSDVNNSKVSDDTSSNNSGFGCGSCTSHYLKASNFGFNIPTGSTINGIVTEIQRRGTATGPAPVDNAVKIVKSDGTVGSENKASGVNWTTSNSYFSYGSSSNLWSETWTAEDINDADFGAVLQVSSQGDEEYFSFAMVDHIRITVYYTAPADSTPPAVSTLSPTGNATNVALNSNLVMTFDEAVDVETGNITIKKGIDDSTLETIDVTSGQVTGTGTTTITINPTANFVSDQEYYVLIDATAFDDTAGNSYAGMSADSEWNFWMTSWNCGDSLFDSRDDKSYTTVAISSQCWMKQNINYGTLTAGANSQGTDCPSVAATEKHCYSDNEANCTTYGGLYQWNQTMCGASSCNGTGAQPDDDCASPVQGICPTGWHIPSHYEFTTLERAICTSGSCATDFPFDASTTGWRGTDEGTNLKTVDASHFSGLLAGYSELGSFSNLTSYGYFWSSLESGGFAWRRYLGSGITGIARNADGVGSGFSVRCVSDTRLDIAPPVQSAWSPASASTIYTATPTITFTTDENASCKISLTDDAYGDIEGDNCSGSGTTSQTCTSPDLGADGSKTVYIACTDNTNADTAGTNDSLTYTLSATTTFITSWKTDNAGTSNSTSITIPTTGVGYSYQVDWNNDGDFTDVNTYGNAVDEATTYTGSVTFDFGSASTYTIRIKGTFPRIYFNNGGDKLKFLAITQWGTNAWTSMSRAFYGVNNLNITATDAPNLASVTDMSLAFYNNTSANLNVGNWDTGSVINMNTMFFGCTSFNEDITGWDTSNVTNMEGMFRGATSFNQLIGVWDVSKVTTFSYMFYDADAFAADLSSWDLLASPISMIGMFYNSTYNHSGITGWDVTNVTNMGSMFFNDTSFNQNISGWDTSNVTAMDSMFRGTTSFNQNIGGWDVNQVTNFANMFLSATGLSTANYDALLSGWAAQSPLSASEAFHGGSSKYCDSASRLILTSAPNSWVITDGGLADCTPPAPSSFSPASGATIDDTTPTVTFTTDENAYCRASFNDDSYALASDDIDCTGDGTTSQTCEITDLGADGAKNVYIACSDGTNEDTNATNENLTYTLSTNASPSAPTLVSPANASYTNDTTPTLSANYLDPDSADVGTTNYRISSSGLADCTNNTNVIAWGTSSATSDENENTSITISAGQALSSDATYYWCAQNNDGTATSSWTTMGSFTLDTTAPSTTATAGSYTFGTLSIPDVTVTLSCSDGSGSGCLTTYYCISENDTCTPNTVYTNPVSVGSTGYIRYYSTDSVSNNESISSKVVRIASGSGGGLSTPTTQESTILPPVIQQIVEIPQQIAQQITNVLAPIISPTTQPEQITYPSVEEAVPEEAQIIFQGGNLISKKQFDKISILPLPEGIKDLALKFPQFADTLEKVGITKTGDVERLATTKLVFPSLSEVVGAPSGFSIADFTAEQKTKVPSNIVFAKTGNNNIDFNINVAVSGAGEPIQSISTIQNKPLYLTLKPDHPAESIKGYIILRSTSPTGLLEIKNKFSADLQASLFNENDGVKKDIVLSEFDYAEVGGVWTAEINAPTVDGQFELRSVVQYVNKTKDNKTSETLSMILVVDPEGYIYEKTIGDREIRISNANVSIYWLNPASKQYELWPAKSFQQINPQITDKTGKYSFLVPPGDYYIKVETKDYKDYQSSPFKVEQGAGVHMNIELKTKNWWGKLFSAQNIIIILLSIVIIMLGAIFGKMMIKKKDV